MKKLIFVFLIIIGHVSGQDNIDYIIKTNGDTLYGRVKDRKMGFREEQLSKIRYQGEGYILPKRFKPHQIAGYSAQGRVYESLSIQTKGLLSERFVLVNRKPNFFLRREYSDSRIKLFYHDFHDDDFHIISAPYIWIINSFEMARATQGVLGLKRNLLASYLNQYPELVQGIKEKNINSVEEIVGFFQNQENR